MSELTLTAEQVAQLRALPVDKLIEYWDGLEAHGRATGKLPQVVRMLCLHDLYYLLVRVCNRVDLLPCINRPGFIDNQFMFERCREVEAAPNGYCDLWAREHGKDLADDTPMLTANRGWTTHGELVVGDRVFAPSGKAVKVIALSERYTESKCYQITFSDGAQIVAGAGHLWRLRQKIKRRIANSDLRRLEFQDYIATTEEMATDGGRLDVGTSAALEYPHADLPIDPYILGCWLGDGHTGAAVITMMWEDAQPLLRRLEANGHTWKADKTASRALSYRIDVRDRSLCLRGHAKTPENLYRGACKKCKAKYQRHRMFGDPLEPVVLNGLSQRLQKLGLLSKGCVKHIPDVYMHASAEQRMELLRGLMDTDGCCSTRGTATFANTNEKLAYQVRDLAASLALQPHIRMQEVSLDSPKATNGIYRFWQVGFQAHKERNPFHIKRKADRAIEGSCYYGNRTVQRMERIASVPTRCIQVEGGMYAAGRELVPTHNSSIISFGLTLQNILQDPEVTIGLFSFTRPMAKAFLRTLMREIESNHALHAAFPDIFHGTDIRQYAKFSEDDGVLVKRKSNPAEATIEAFGLEALPVGRHFKVLIYDDVVVPSSVTTPEQVAKTLELLQHSYNLGTAGGVRRMIGTRYSYADAYGTVTKNGTFKVRAHPGKKGGTEDGETVLWDEETHRKKREEQGPWIYGSQILLDPRSDAQQGFRREWLRHYTSMSPAQAKKMTKYILVDSANTKKKSSDFTAIWVVGLGVDGNYYALDMVRDRLNLKERGDRLFALHRKWKPIQVRHEKYGLLSDCDHYKQRMEQESYRFNIIEVAGQTSKLDRIKRLIPIFEAGKFYLPKTFHVTDWQKNVVDLVHEFIESEFYPFPGCLHDDQLDSLARICEPDLQLVWPREEVLHVPPPAFKAANQSTAWMA